MKRAKGNKSAAEKEELRTSYRPDRVRLLFIGEAPPASGRFFFQGDSGLYRAIRDVFVRILPGIAPGKFLEEFQARGCYLVDLCGRPVDKLVPSRRRKARAEGEQRLAKIFVKLSPKIAVVVVKAIERNVRRAQRAADWSGETLFLPYPGRWHKQRKIFQQRLSKLLREVYRAR